MLGAPLTCADVLKKIEKRMLDAGVQQPQLKIVPKGLSSGSDVLATCENGTQHIVHRLRSSASAPLGKRAEVPDTSGKKR